MATAVQLLRRDADLTSERATVDSTWQEIAEFMAPHLAQITTKRQVEGQPFMDRVFDSTAIHAALLLASNIHDNLTPSSQPWLSLKLRDENLNRNNAVRVWLEDCARRMYLALSQSNFNTAVHEVYQSLVTFGIGNLYVEESTGNENATTPSGFRGLMFRCEQVGRYTISEDRNGMVDLCFRRWEMANRVIATTWTKLPDEFAKMAQDKPDDKSWILHAVYPNTDYEAGRKGYRKGMKWRSCYLLVTQRHILAEGGFHEFPFMVPRWNKTAGEVYGSGPGHTALPDVKSLNATKELILKAAALAIQPPSLEEDEAVLGDLDRTPGGRNVVNKGGKAIGDVLQFIDTRSRPDLGQMTVKDLQQAVHLIFFTDQLQLRESPQMTATEVQVRREMMLSLLGPTGGRLTAEFLNRMVWRVFGLMARAGEFLPAPEILKQNLARADLDVEYEGPMVRSQRAIELTAQDRILQFALALEATHPEVMDNLNLDKMLRARAEITGLPADQVNPEEWIEETRQARAQAAQAQQKAAAAMEAMKVAAPLVAAGRGRGGPVPEGGPPAAPPTTSAFGQAA